MLEQAGDAFGFDAGEIVEHAMLAFRRKQIRQIAQREFAAVIAEQRFGAAIGRTDIAIGVEHHDAFGRGVEDGAEFFGIGMAGRQRFGNQRFGDRQFCNRNGLRDRGRDGSTFVVRAREDQRKRGIAIPGNRVEAGVGRRGRRARFQISFGILRLARGDHHRRTGVRRRGRVGDAGFDIERVEAAGILQHMQAGIAHLREEGGIGVKQPVEPVDQNADRQQVEQRLVAPGFAAWRRL